MKKILLLLLISSFFTVAFSQDAGVDNNIIRVYPTHWWAGMKHNKIQLMLRGENVGKAATASISYPGITVTKITRVENKNYLFLDVTIAPSAKPGSFNINAGNKKVAYQLKQRNPGNGKSRIRGINAKDLIYLIMPDRFSNGDPSNDRVAGMKDQSLNRDSIYHRHGGDLKGIQNHLDYLQDLGVTAIWLNPVIENDMKERTEHGYAFTDHYKIERRIGGEAAYHELSDAIHQKGMKLIQDAVYNHTGIEHFLYRDMPDSTWFHRWAKYTQTNYKDQSLFDPYAAPSDKKIMSDGWFVRAMPDVNHDNPLFANYLIHHAIWTTEEFGIDGWRIDTYPYNDLGFMNRCNKALLDEYPQLHIFGETWVHGVINQAFFTENNMNIPFKSNLPAATDFQTHMYGILPALKENFGWTEGVNKLYTTLAQDMLYKDPARNVNFLDNHDKTRFYSEIGEDFNKYKMGVAWLLTARGIPQLYYGLEILMKGVSNPDGWVRLDFPGGWSEDKANKFTKEGRTSQENEAFEYVKKIANYRKQSTALTTGKFMQYIPDNGVYTYFRYDNKQTVMIVMNTATEKKNIKPSDFSERTKGFQTALNIADGTKLSLANGFEIPAQTTWILELGR
jgi:neopullulanase